MRADELLTRTLDAAAETDRISWVVEQPSRALLTLRRGNTVHASGLVRLRCDDATTRVDVRAKHYRCCLARYMLQEKLSAMASSAVAKEGVSQRHSAAKRLFSSVHQAQQLGQKKQAIEKRLLYTNRPPPFLRHTSDHPLHYGLCLQPSVELRIQPSDGAVTDTPPSTSELASEAPAQRGPTLRDLALKMVPLFMGVRVCPVTVPFITNPTSHDDVHGDRSQDTNTTGPVVPSLCLLPLEHVEVNKEGTFVEARYAPVEYGLSAVPYTPAPSGKKRSRTAAWNGTQLVSAVDEVPLQFEFFVPSLPKHANGWSHTAQAITRLESYRPQGPKLSRYGLNAYTEDAQKVLNGSTVAYREKRVLLGRPAQLLDAYCALASPHVSSCGAITNDSEESGDEEVLVFSTNGNSESPIFFAREHQGLTFHSLAQLRCNRPIPVEPCAMANSIVLSSVLPTAVLTHTGTTDSDALTSVDTLADFASALGTATAP